MKGQSLVEVLVGIALGALLIIGAVAVIAPALRGNQRIAQVQTETQLAYQLSQNVQAWAAGNWNNVLALATGTSNAYYLNASSSPFIVAGNSTTSGGGSASFGQLVFGTTTDNNPGALWFKAMSAPGSNGTLTSVTFRGVGCNESSSPWNLSACSNNYLGVAMYADNSGSPSTLLASSTGTSSAALMGSNAYATSTVNITAPITAGQQYWFAAIDQTTTSTWLGYEFPSSSGVKSTYYLNSPTYSFPSSTPAGTFGAEAPYIYATYTMSGTLVQATGTESIVVGSTTYTRYFYLNDVYRDANGNVTTTVSGNNYDPSTKLVGVVIGIASSTVPSTTFTFFLTRNQNNTMNQTNWAGGSGQNNPITIVGNQYSSSSNATVNAQGQVQISQVSSLSNGENAADYLGQNSWTTESGQTSQTGMDLPSYVAYDPVAYRLFVADTHNNRVLVFAVGTSTFTNNEGASDVLGQINFNSSTAATSQRGMNNPRGLAYDPTTGRLFVADQYNNRVLVFAAGTSTVSSTNEAATNVLGQTLYTTATATTTQKGMNNPDGLAYDPTTGRLFVSDQSNSRVLVFAAGTSTITNGENASNLLGQTSWTSSSSVAASSGMELPTGLAYDSATGRLFSADSGYNRTLVFAAGTSTIKNGEGALNVLGEPNFTQQWGGATTTQYLMDTPEGLAYDDSTSRLFEADSSNARILIFAAGTSTISNGMPASNVLGQINFSSSTATTSQNGLSGELGLAYDAANGRLFVGDTINHRIIDFGVNNSGYAATGTLESAIFDTQDLAGVQLNSVTWQGSLPGADGTEAVKFQFAVSDSSGGPWNFIGPDGTGNTYFTGNPGTAIPIVSTAGAGYNLFSGYRYFRYLITLFADHTLTFSPTVTQVTVNWSP